MEDDFQSLSKGVFVLPFQASAEASTRSSRLKRPLKEVYDTTYAKCQQAHEDYEASRTDEQLQEISEWLDRCSKPPFIKLMTSVTRLPIAIMQNISASLPPLLSTLLTHVHTIHGRDVVDLTGAVRAVSLGFVGETKKSGRTGLDEVERWWLGLKGPPPLLLHIDQAQSVPPSVLSELLYILTLRPSLSIRVLLSVSSTATFLSTWTHVEPTSIDLSILQSGRNGKKSGAANAILKTAADAANVPLAISEDLRDELWKEEGMTGGGAAGVLKALKWSLLKHSIASPLNRLNSKNENADETSRDSLRMLQTTKRATTDGQTGEDIPGRSLLEIPADPDLSSVTNPAPRIAILHALSKPDAFLPQNRPRSTPPPAISVPSAETSTVGPVRGRKSRKDTSLDTQANAGTDVPLVNGDNKEQDEEYKELRVLFDLWRSAGKNVNLWDWLEGFRATMADHDDPDQPDVVVEGSSDEAVQVDSADKGRLVTDEENGDTIDPVAGLEEEQERLHAIFVRFCEEARMLGIVRARGKTVGRRGDEVVKGIGLV